MFFMQSRTLLPILLCKRNIRSVALLNVSSRLSPTHRIWRRCSAENLVKSAPKRVQPYLRLIRMDKPIGTWLLYNPCTWSIALATPAGCLPDPYLLTLFGAGSFFMRGAGCVINDLWDRDFDRRVERTKSRPLACGEVSERQAVALLAGLLSVSLGILLQLNWLSVFVGASSMSLVILYPLAKRYTYWPQLVLGITLNWGVLIAWSHLLPEYPDVFCIIPLYLSNVCHTIISDTIYSHQDKVDDLIVGVKSTALKFGDHTKLWLSGFSSIMISSLALVGYVSDQTWPYYATLTGTAAHLAWQVGTVDINDGNDCWRKFKSNQYLGALLFFGIVASNLLRKKIAVNDKK